jgi:hypothetical protein
MCFHVRPIFLRRVPSFPDLHTYRWEKLAVRGHPNAANGLNPEDQVDSHQGFKLCMITIFCDFAYFRRTKKAFF